MKRETFFIVLSEVFRFVFMGSSSAFDGFYAFNILYFNLGSRTNRKICVYTISFYSIAAHSFQVIYICKASLRIFTQYII